MKYLFSPINSKISKISLELILWLA